MKKNPEGIYYIIANNLSKLACVPELDEVKNALNNLSTALALLCRRHFVETFPTVSNYQQMGRKVDSL